MKNTKMLSSIVFKELGRATLFTTALATLAACNNTTQDSGAPAAAASKNPAGNVSDSISPAAVNSGLYGLWKAERPLVRGQEVDVTMTLKFQPDSVTAYMTCTYPDKSALTASASAPAFYSDNIIKIETESRKSVHDKGRDCTASIAAGRMQLDLQADGNTLMASNPDDSSLQPLQFFRL